MTPAEKPRVRVKAISRRCLHPGECTAPDCRCLPTAFSTAAQVDARSFDEIVGPIPAFLDRRRPP